MRARRRSRSALRIRATRRAPPRKSRQPLPTDHDWHPVAVYAPDEITEEEFQDWYALQQPAVEELRLKY